jgi:hypothetical protein
MVQIARRPSSRRLNGCAQVAILDQDRPPNPSPEGGFLEATDPCAGRPMGSSWLGTSDYLSLSLFIPASTSAASARHMRYVRSRRTMAIRLSPRVERSRSNCFSSGAVISRPSRRWLRRCVEPCCQVVPEATTVAAVDAHAAKKCPPVRYI